MHLHKQFFDDDLLVFLKKGWEFALTAICRKYWQHLYSAVYHVLKNGQTCEDTIQEIFLKLWLAREDIQIKISLLTYLLTAEKLLLPIPEIVRQQNNAITQNPGY